MKYIQQLTTQATTKHSTQKVNLTEQKKKKK